MNDTKTIQSRVSPPDTKSWYQYIWKAEQEIPNRLEDAAKFLATMVSISLTIFLAIGKKAFENTTDVRLVFAMILWFCSLLGSFFVMFPMRYRFVDQSVKSMKEMNRKIVLRKRLLLIVSLLFYLTALVMLALIFFKI